MSTRRQGLGGAAANNQGGETGCHVVGQLWDKQHEGRAT